jgi:hypothetical protein
MLFPFLGESGPSIDPVVFSLFAIERCGLERIEEVSPGVRIREAGQLDSEVSMQAEHVAVIAHLPKKVATRIVEVAIMKQVEAHADRNVWVFLPVCDVKDSPR